MLSVPEYNEAGEQVGSEQIDEGLLGETVAALRSRLGLDRATPGSTAGDRLAFLPFLIGAFAVGVGPAAILVGVLWWWLA